MPEGMRIVSLIDDRAVIERILQHLGLWEQGVRGGLSFRQAPSFNTVHLTQFVASCRKFLQEATTWREPLPNCPLGPGSCEKIIEKKS